MIQQSPADDLAILNPPAIKLTLAGVDVVCREYGFIEELKLRNISQPFIDDLMLLLINSDANSGDIDVREMDAVLAKHFDAIGVLMAHAINQPVEFVNALNIADGNLLLNAWWSANGPFFTRCVLTYVRSVKAKSQKAAGQMCTQPLSPTGTAPNESANIPTGN